MSQWARLGVEKSKRQTVKQQLQKMNQKDQRAESKGVRSWGLWTEGATDKREKIRARVSSESSLNMGLISCLLQMEGI